MVDAYGRLPLCTVSQPKGTAMAFNRALALKALESIDSGEHSWDQGSWSTCMASHTVAAAGEDLDALPDMEIGKRAYELLFGRSLLAGECPCCADGATDLFGADNTREDLTRIVDELSEMENVNV